MSWMERIVVIVALWLETLHLKGGRVASLRDTCDDVQIRTAIIADSVLFMDILAVFSVD